MRSAPQTLTAPCLAMQPRLRVGGRQEPRPGRVPCHSRDMASRFGGEDKTSISSSSSAMPEFSLISRILHGLITLIALITLAHQMPSPSPSLPLSLSLSFSHCTFAHL